MIVSEIECQGAPRVEFADAGRHPADRASLARRLLDLGDEIANLDRLIEALVSELAPGLLELEGVGAENAGELLVTAGDNPDRLASEAGFSMLCGASPISASSGKTIRHRLNPGGNRHANSALHMTVVCRMRTDQRTRDYVQRRLAEGKTKREIMRCLKRYVAREVYRALTQPTAAAPPVRRQITQTRKTTSKTT